jgi:benzylsuccinate CoA-transferase BbsF subunit
MADRLPLEGIRVADFCWVWAGPSGTELLAYLGAEVIKIESRARLDTTRRQSFRTGGEMPDTNLATTYNALSINKRSVTFDISQPKGKELVRRLIDKSDVVTNNFSGGVMDRLGFGYSKLKKTNPGIIMVTMSGFGSTGPYRDYRGYDPIFNSVSGVFELTGYEDGPPGRGGIVGHLDITNGGMLAFNTICALEYRARTGKGQYIDIAQFTTGSFILGEAYMDYFMNRKSPTRVGNKDDLWAPHNCYRCRGEDKWVSIAITAEEEWVAFCQAVGKPEWIKDKRFADEHSRWQNQEELDKLVTEWTVNHTHYEVMDILQKAGVAAVPSMSQDEIAHDPHLIKRGAFVDVEHPETTTRPYLAPPWRFSDTPNDITHAPLLGQDNEYVCLEVLGMPIEEFATLVGENVIY